MPTMSQNTRQDFEYIVVGGGSAGCTVAGRLAEANAGSVLLLEGGDRAEANPETLSSDGFRYAFSNDRVMLDRMSEPQRACADRTLYAGSGRGMGGSGGVNGMVYTRGDRLDFFQWPAGWQWADVEPAYQQLERRLRIRHREATVFTEIALSAAKSVGFKRKHGLNDGALNGFMG
jgi:choline dehydrogenase